MILQNEMLLYEISQIENDRDLPLIRDNREPVAKIIEWIHEYLSKPHPELGRPGPVCPFVPTALEKKLLYLTVYEGTEITAQALREMLLQLLDTFLEMEPKTGNNAQFKAILLLFPNIPADKSHNLVEMAQQDLRFHFVPKGLMVGEFHSGPPKKAGLWNTSFLPLNSPVPLLAIRHMVPTDVLFLKNEHALITEYLKIYGHMVPSKFRCYIEEAAERFGFDLPEKKPVEASATSVIYHLEKAGISYTPHRHSLCEETIQIPQDFAKALGYDVSRICKALFLRDKKSETYLIAVLPATKQADLAALAQAMGVAKLRMGTREELKRKVGHARFSVTPIGVPDIQTFMDASLMAQPTVLVGSGVEKMEIELAPKDLADLSQAKVFSFALGTGS